MIYNAFTEQAFAYVPPKSQELVCFLFCFVFNFMFMGILSTCMPVHHMSMWCLWRPEEAIGSHGTRVTVDRPSLWVLGIEPKSSGRVASALNHGAVSPAPKSCSEELKIK